MGTPEQILLEAAKLPLNDAAYWLWINKNQLDRATRAPSPPARHDLNDPGVFAKSVRDAIASVRREQENAPDGPTFDRMKMAHPEASDSELKNSIRAAVKLHQDCNRHFSHRNQNYIDDVTAAIESAKRKNPGFSEESYRRAWHELAKAMR